MAARLCHVLIIFGFIVLTSQRNVDWEENIARDSKDLYKLQSLLSKMPRPQPKSQALYRKERTHSKKRQNSNLAQNEREDITQLLDDLEREIKKNYQNQPVALVEPSEEYTAEPRADEAANDSDASDNESAEQVAIPTKTKTSKSSDNSEYSDLLSLLRCNCGFETDQNQVLRCARCNRGDPKRSKSRSQSNSDFDVSRGRHASPRSQSEHLLSLLNKYGKKYKLSDELDAIVIDVSELERNSNPLKSKKRVSPFPLVESQPKSSGLDLSSLQALEYLIQPETHRVKRPKKYSDTVDSGSFPFYRKTQSGLAKISQTIVEAMASQHKDNKMNRLPKSKIQKQGKLKPVLFKEWAKNIRRDLDTPTSQLGIPFEINVSGLSQKTRLQ